MRVHLSDSEWKLMDALWNGNGSTITELTRAMAPDTGWSKHTIITMLARLESKGAVTHTEEGRAKRYAPLLSRSDAQRTATEQFLGKVYGGSLGLMMSAMVRGRALSQQDIDELASILEQAKEGDAL